MELLERLLSSDLTYHLGWMLLHSLWLMTLPAAALAFGLLVVPKRMSRTRYLMSGAALLALAGSLGVVSLLVPARVVAITDAELSPVVEEAALNDRFAEAQPLPPLGEAGVEYHSPFAWLIPGGEENAAAGESMLTPTGGLDPAEPGITYEATPVGDETTEPRGWYARTVAAAQPYVVWAVPAWLLGVVALGLWHLGGLIATHRLRSIGTRPAPRHAARLMETLIEQMGITRAVTLLESAVVQSPVVIGFFKPVVLVPASIFTGLTPTQLEAILAHELAHIRRHDYLVNLFQTLVVTLLFYHPAAWWVSRVIRNERECCCDDIVVNLKPMDGSSEASGGNRRLDYAKALTQVALLRNSDKRTRLSVAADQGSLLERIKRMMGMDDTAAFSGGLSPKAWLAGVLVLLIAVALPITLVAGDDGVAADANEADTMEELVDAKPDEMEVAEQEVGADVIPSVAKLVELAGIELVNGQADRSKLPGLWFQPHENGRPIGRPSLQRRVEEVGFGADGTVYYNRSQNTFYIEQGTNDLGEPLYFGPFAGNPLDWMEGDPDVKAMAVDLVTQVIRSAQRSDWPALEACLLDVAVSMDERWVIPRSILPVLDLGDDPQQAELPIEHQFNMWNMHVVLLRNKESADHPYTSLILACDGERWGLLQSGGAPERAAQGYPYWPPNLSLYEDAVPLLQYSATGILPREPRGSWGLGQEGEEIENLTHAVIAAAPDGTLCTDFYYHHNEYLRGIKCSVAQRATSRNDVVGIRPHESLRRSHSVRIGLTELTERRVPLPSGISVTQEDGTLVIHRPGQPDQRLLPGQRLRVDYANNYALQVIEPQDIETMVANVWEGRTREQVEAVIGLPSRGRDDLPHGWRWYGDPVAADPAKTIYAPGAIAVRFVGDRVVEKRLSPAAEQAMLAQQAEPNAGQPADPATQLLGVWYGQFVDSHYLPTDRWCVWEFREDGKCVYTLGRYGPDGTIDLPIDPDAGESMVVDYDIDADGRLLLYVPGEDTKVCPYDIRNGTAYISVDHPNDFVFSREEHPEQFVRERERAGIEQGARRFESSFRLLAIRWRDAGEDSPQTLAGLLGDDPRLAFSPLRPRVYRRDEYLSWDEPTRDAWLAEHAGLAYLPVPPDWPSEPENPSASRVLLFERPTPARAELFVVRLYDSGRMQYSPESLPVDELDTLLRAQTGQGLDAWAYEDDGIEGPDDAPEGFRLGRALTDHRWVWCGDDINNVAGVVAFNSEGNLAFFDTEGGAKAFVIEPIEVDGRESLRLTDADGEPGGTLVIEFIGDDRIVLHGDEGRELLYREDAYERIKEETLRLRGEGDAGAHRLSPIGYWVQVEAVAGGEPEPVDELSVVELRADGTVAVQAGPDSIQAPQVVGRWEHDLDERTLTTIVEDDEHPEGLRITWSVAFDGDTMTITGGEDRYVYRRFSAAGEGDQPEEAAAATPRITLAIRGEGELVLDVDGVAMAGHQLLGHARDRGWQATDRVVLSGPHDLPYRLVVQVIDTLREAGYTNVTLAAARAEPGDGLPQAAVPDDLLGVWFVQWAEGDYLPPDLEYRWEFRGDGELRMLLNDELLGQDRVARYAVDLERGVIDLVELGEVVASARYRLDEGVLTLSFDEDNEADRLVLTRNAAGNEEHQRERAMPEPAMSARNRMVSVSNLRTLHTELHAWAREHDNRYPAGLMDILQPEFEAYDRFLAPWAEAELPEGFPEWDAEVKSDWLASNTSYAFATPERALGNDTEVAVVFELPLIAGMETIGIAYDDNHAKRLPYDEADALILEQTGRDLMGWMEHMGREQRPAPDEAGEADQAPAGPGDAARGDAIEGNDFELLLRVAEAHRDNTRRIETWTGGADVTSRRVGPEGDGYSMTSAVEFVTDQAQGKRWRWEVTEA